MGAMELTPEGLVADLPTVSFGEFSAALHRDAASARVPIGAMLELTYRCNFDCVHCYVVEHRPQGELSAAELRRVLEELRAAGTLFLTITGGEPLTRPDFAEVWRAAAEQGFLLTLFTNGGLIDEATLALFAEHPPHKVEVTLYGASEATYRAVTRRRAMRARVLANVDRLRALGVAVYLKAVGLRENAGEIAALRAEAEARGVGGFFRFDNEITVRTDCRRGPADHRPSVAAALAQDREDPRRIAELRRLYLKTRGRRDLRDRRLFRCGAGRTSLVIDPRGRLQTCALHRDEPFDLRRGTVAEGWRHLQQVAAREITRPTRCRSCDKVALCGACPGNNALESGGDREAPPDFLCELTYARVEAFLADLRPRAAAPLGRRLPLHLARTCPRPWLAVREPLGELIWPEPRGRPPRRRLPTV